MHLHSSLTSTALCLKPHPSYQTKNKCTNYLLLPWLEGDEVVNWRRSGRYQLRETTWPLQPPLEKTLCFRMKQCALYRPHLHMSGSLLGGQKKEMTWRSTFSITTEVRETHYRSIHIQGPRRSSDLGLRIIAIISLPDNLHRMSGIEAIHLPFE